MPITRSFQVAAKGALAEVHAAVVRTAKVEHAEVMRTAPIPRRFTRVVDGTVGAAEEQVKPHGVITYMYPRLEEVVQYAMEMLFRFSPVLSGDYRRGHTIFLNGQPVTNLSAWKEGDEVVITNYLPYARKIDMGQMKMRVAGTDRTYERAVSATNRRYGNLYKALHTYRGLVNGAVLGPGGGVVRKTIVHGDKGRFIKGTRTTLISGGAQNKSEVRYPAILFREV